MKSGRKVGNARSIRGEDFFLKTNVILGEKSERRDHNSFSFLENINFWKSLPRGPEFEYPSLIIEVCFFKKGNVGTQVLKGFFLVKLLNT